MHLALLLHIYQPPTQFPSTVRKIADQSYGKIVELLEEYPKTKVTLNINASLTEQLQKIGLSKLIERMAKLSEKGQIEFTGSAAYHPILPDLPKREIVRQIRINTRINQSYFESAYDPRGFFPPEMAYSKGVGEVVERLGFKWIVVDGTAIADWRKYLKIVYSRKDGGILAFPREDILSFKIAFGRIRTMLGLIRAIGAGELGKKQYVVLAMDGETFGHHQAKQLRFLRKLFEANKSDRRIKLVTISELSQLYTKRKSVDLMQSTWGYTEFVDGKQVWARWSNPKNLVHKVLNEMKVLAIESVDSGDVEARNILDRALNSDSYWWASGKPFWYPDMITRGARMFYRSVMLGKNATDEQKRRMRYLFDKKLKNEMVKMKTKKQRKKILGR